MPKLVSQLAQGNAFSRSAEGGATADEATRVWKVLLNAPNESWDVSVAVGVFVGDPYSSTNPIPCTSIDVKADGESRMTRIVTASYRSTPGADPSGNDPGTQSPEVRPAKFSTSTSLYEMPAPKWRRYPGGDWAPARNPVGDPVEGVTRLEPITTIRVTQFDILPGTVFSKYVGNINSVAMPFGTFATFEPHTVMFRGVEAQPQVETFGNIVFRGFTNNFEFCYRQNWLFGEGAVGWDQAIVQEGYNCFASVPNLVSTTIDAFALPLQFEGPDSVDAGKLVTPLALAENATAGQRVRAMVFVAAGGKYAGQNSSAMPIALNDDGSPRKITSTQKPLVRRYQVQDEIDLASIMSLRLD